MGMTPSIFSKIKKYISTEIYSVIELGCQQLGALSAARALPEELSGYKDGDYTKSLYESVGLRYTSVDVYGGDIHCDFNEQELALPHQHDMVTNLGTSEHVFNQYNVFSSIHNLTKINGLMVHFLPLKHSPHGLLTYNVDFFISLCFSNHYELVELTFCWRDADEEYIFDSLPEVIKHQTTEQYAFFVARKSREDKFVSPQQIIYNPLISIDAITTLCSNDIYLMSQVLQFTFTDAVLNHTFNFDEVTGNYPDVILYGAGHIGQAILRFAKHRGKIKAVVDENLKLADDRNIKRLIDIEDIDVPVYIASDCYREEIRHALSTKYSEGIIFLN